MAGLVHEYGCFAAAETSSGKVGLDECFMIVKKGGESEMVCSIEEKGRRNGTGVILVRTENVVEEQFVTCNIEEKFLF